MSEAGDNRPTVTRRSPRWMWGLLVVSLSINLLIAGIVIGSVWAIKRGGFWNVPTVIERNARFMRGLPEDRRDEIRSIFFEYRDDLRPYWQSLREARRDIGRLLRSETYSRAELDAAMETLFEQEKRARQAAKPMLQDMLSRLDRDERIHFLRVFVPILNRAQLRGDSPFRRP